ncbi:MAG: glycosyltransferase family 39 protein [Pyrinomonadaceae bacterium]|nr:glycosyltransferase family 39 protein [Pyrinomonadaceae bacterium]
MAARQFTKLDAMVLAAVVLIGLIHLPYPFDGDQALFTVGAEKMSRGAILYRDFWDLKQPGVFFFYLLGGRLFGFTEVGIHTLELLYQTAFAIVLLFTLKSYFESRAIAALVPLLTIGFYYGVTGSWHLTQVEGLVGFPLFLSLWFASEASRREGRGRAQRLFLSGFMGGIVLLFKLLFLPLLLAFWMAAIADAVLRKRERIPAALLSIIAPALLGLLLPLAIVIGYFARHKTLGLLYYVCFEYPSSAIAALPGWRLGSLAQSLFWFAATFAPLTALVFVWASSAAASKRTELARMPLLFVNLALWLALGFCVILVQRLSWWDYHYMLLFVPIGILAAKGLDILWTQAKEAKPSLASKKGRIAASLSLALLFSPVLVSLTRKSLSLITHGFAYGKERRLLYQSEISGSYQTALSETEFLSQPDSLPGGIFVGGNPIYYHLSGRDQAIASNGWMLELFLLQQWAQLNEQLAQSPPTYIFIAREYAKLVPERSPQTTKLISDHYRVLRTSPAGVWYVLQQAR